MKKIVLIISLLFPFIVSADSLKFDTYQQCFNYQSGNIVANGTGNYKYCMQAKCSNGVWQSSFLFNKNTLVCANGNRDFYYYIVSSGCYDYTGACSSNNSAKYCGMEVRYDCNKINNGSIYVSKKTTTTTKGYATITKKTTTTKRVTPTTTTVPITESPKDNNSYLKSLSVKGYSIMFNKEELSYEITVDKDTKDLEVSYETESDKASATVINNKDINVDNPIIITVTAEDGSKKDYTISIRLKKLSNNVNVTKMSIDGYEFEFDPKKYEYDLTIKNDVSSLVYNIELEDNNAKYEINGDSDLKDGSVINVKIIAEDGTEANYNFKIRKTSDGDTSTTTTITSATDTKPSKKKNNALIIVIVIIFIGILGVVAFKFIRKVIPAKKDEKYDYE